MAPIVIALGAAAAAGIAWALSQTPTKATDVPALPPGPTDATPPAAGDTDAPSGGGGGSSGSPSPGDSGPAMPTDSGGAVGPGTGTAAIPTSALPPGMSTTPSNGGAAGTIKPTVPPVAGNPILSKGSTGDAVKVWQKIIGVTQDGIFGDNTVAATKVWQKNHGLLQDGKVGPKTWLAAASPTGVIPVTGKTAGAVSVSPTGVVDDAFDTLVAAAIAKKDAPALMALATQAESRGLLDIARSIRDEAARITMGAPAATPPGPDKPTVPSVSKPTGRAIISAAAGSKGPDVIEWQKVLGVKQDGVFGSGTDVATRKWQTAHGLVADGVVGPKSWALAYQQAPALAVTPRPAVAVTTPTVRALLSSGSSGKDVSEWQGIIGVKADGAFGPGTDAATKKWQSAHGLKADGIVGPTSWAMAYSKSPGLAVTIGAPNTITINPSGPPAGMTKMTHPSLAAGSVGTDVKTWQVILGINPDGAFGPGTTVATKAWQAKQGLVADGKVGPASWAKAQALGLVA